jgi:RNA polymerase sigma-70 factor (ECF subfamily)
VGHCYVLETAKNEGKMRSDNIEPVGNQGVAFSREHVLFVERVLARCGVHGEDARDLRQDVLLQAHRAAREFRGEARIDTWLYRIAIREAARHRRRSRARLRGQCASEYDEMANTPLHSVLQHETREQLQRVLTCMDPPKREALEMHVFDDLPVKEVAARLGCPLQTAYSRLQAARSQAALLLERAPRQRATRRRARVALVE